jgi:outer membrane lipoprotein LolB
MSKCDCRWPLFRLAGCLLLAALLSACAALPGAPGEQPRRDALSDFSLDGRFSLRYEDKNYSGRLSWRHRGNDDELLLSSPFGQGLAEIFSAPQGAQLTLSDGKTYEAADAEKLTLQVLGYPLPLSRLTDWVRGRALGGELERDAFGRLLRLRHEAWKIDYDYADDDRQALPSRIFAESAGGIELRLRIDQWRHLMPGD